MTTSPTVSFSRTQSFRSPFEHFVSLEIFEPVIHEVTVEWLRGAELWKLVETDFYEQYEFNLWDIVLPPELEFLRARNSIHKLRRDLEQLFGARLGPRVNIVAHKLVPEQRIRIHNDFIPGGETHRLLVQLGTGATEEDGGLLMFFKGPNASDVSKVFRPLSNTAVGFRISPHSHHAVSTQRRGDRFTLVYSFFAETNVV